MANPFLGTDAPNIATGWGRAPELSAPSIGSLVAGILGNRLGQQELAQKSIAEAIKQQHEQQQSQAYIKAAQDAGLLPAGDLGGLGLKGGESLADLLHAQQKEEYMKPYYEALTAAAGRRGGGGGGGGGGGDAGQGTTGPEIVEKEGIKYLVVRTSKSVTYKRLPGQGTSGGVAGDDAQAAYEAAQQAEATAQAKRQRMEERHGALTKEGFPGAPHPFSLFDPSSWGHKGGPPSPERQAQLKEKLNKVVTEETRADKVREALAKKYPKLTTLPEPEPQPFGRKQRSAAVATSDGTDDTGATVPPLLARPDASKGAPVNLPQVGDQRPGPNGTTVEWDGHGWKIVG